MVSRRTLCRMIRSGPWPHPMRWSPNWSMVWPQVQRREWGGGRNRGIPSHILMATMNSCWGIARPRLGLGIARSHAPAGGDAMEFSRAWSLREDKALHIVKALWSRESCRWCWEVEVRSASGRASLRDALAGNSSSGVSSEVSMEGSTSKRPAVSDRVVFRLPTKAADAEEEDSLSHRPPRRMGRVACFQVW